MASSHGYRLCQRAQIAKSLIYLRRSAICTSSAVQEIQPVSRILVLAGANEHALFDEVGMVSLAVVAGEDPVMVL